MSKDLKDMSRKELEKLLSDVKKALTNAQARDRRAARKAAEKAAAEFGFTLNELEEAPKPAAKPRKSRAKSKGAVSAPKYANPADPAQTWTGKGRKPNWFIAEVEKGTAEEKLKI
ncbi:MAG: H-NS histone family protein [Pseudomonadota bacterium]